MRSSIAFAVLFFAGCERPSPPPPVVGPYEHAPGVANVEVFRAGSRRLVHVLDWHYVAKDRFAADMGLDGDALDAAYAQHLDEVEAVQAEQEKFLRYLIHNERITAVHLEAVTPDNLAAFESVVVALRDALPSLDASLVREQLLGVGAAGKLAVEGPLLIKPAEEEAAYRSARPNAAGELDIDANERRESAICKTVLAGDNPLVVVVLGRDHDLSDNLPADVEYVRVAVKRLPE